MIVNTLIPGGCILLARKMLDSDLMEQSPLVVKLWVWILLTANWKDRGQLKRGQLVTTIREMQEAMSHYSGWKKVTPTADAIRSAYGALTKATRIATRRTTRGMVITIVNYDTYQDLLSYAAHTADHKGNATGAGATPHDTEEGKERKNNHVLPDAINYDKLFDWFWKEYPKKGGNKKKVREKLERTVKTREQGYQLMLALDNYMEQVEQERANGFKDLQFKNIETFINHWQGYIPDDWREQWEACQSDQDSPETTSTTTPTPDNGAPPEGETEYADKGKLSSDVVASRATHSR